MKIVELDAEGIDAHLNELAQLLLDGHASNMALGLAPPLTRERAADAYRVTAARLAPGERVLLGALDGDILVGAVHIARAEAENGRHRAEIQRLVVSPTSRGMGIGRALLEAAVERARELRLGLLWLTTHEETDADQFYERLGWTRLGVIPAYSTLPDGSLAGNAYYYLRLENIA
ncbi:MAG TPA: GNAT family N-acetyltransferase [Gaiellaceae bacterium]|nr:GNAT family N-acetyltransferase [Gaiellaceae bacterium]